MTLTVTAKADMYSTPVRVRLDVDLTPSATRLPITLNRVHPDGTRWPVITDAGGARLSSGAWAGFDYHSPSRQYVTYEATVGSTTAVSNKIVVTPKQIWLHHPADPTLSVSALFAPEDAFGDDSTADESGIFYPLGSDMAVSVFDGTLKKSSSVTLAFLSEKVPALEKLRRAGGPLLLNVPAAPGWDVLWRWIQPTGFSVKNPGVVAAGGRAAYPHRYVTMPYVVVDQPVVNQEPPWNYKTLAAAFPSYAAMNAAYADLQALATNSRSG